MSRSCNEYATVRADFYLRKSYVFRWKPRDEYSGKETDRTLCPCEKTDWEEDLENKT